MFNDPLKKTVKSSAPAKSASRNTPSGYYPSGYKKTAPKSGSVIDKKTNKIIVAKKGGAIKTKTKK